jgi:hypothetical protein
MTSAKHAPSKSEIASLYQRVGSVGGFSLGSQPLPAITTNDRFSLQPTATELGVIQDGTEEGPDETLPLL